MSERSKYNPNGRFVRLDSLEPGEEGSVFFRGVRSASEDQGRSIKVDIKIETSQEGNPAIKTQDGDVLAGGTAVLRSPRRILGP